VRALVAISPCGVPTVECDLVDVRVIRFACPALTTIIGVSAGLIPAWQRAVVGFVRGMQQGSRRTPRADPIYAPQTWLVAEVRWL